MPSDQGQTTRGSRPLLAAAGLLCLLALTAIAGWPGRADSAPLRVVVLGRGVDTVPPDCPGARKQCQVAGRVTGFQSLAGDFVKPFQVPFEGKVISWSISLGRPYAQQTREHGDEQAYFDFYFDRPSKARVAVLRRVEGAKPPKYRLVRQGPAQILNPYFGQTVEFALDHPLGAAQGDMIGLTIPTWAPAFWHARSCEESSPGVAINQAGCDRVASRNTWRASRRDGRCVFNKQGEELEAQISKSYPQQKVGSEKEYGCYYSAARLLYTATLVKKPRNAG
ncbi:MAG TPA: hypothetical protein VKA89_12365 [Solirubrobacterales bacterium]|nr:hypothetical protein [Solirubrobacterales bacterium]